MVPPFSPPRFVRADLLEKLDSVWHHVVGEPDDAACKGWLRHVLRRHATRSERCRASGKWRVFQEARFVGQEPLVRANGNLGGAPLPLSLGMVHSTLGAGASLALGVAAADDAELIRADAARFAECVIC